MDWEFNPHKKQEADSILFQIKLSDDGGIRDLLLNDSMHEFE
jgi:hypothetical protein